MKSKLFQTFALAGVTFAGLVSTSVLRADTTVYFAGGNASQTVLYDRVTNILSGGVSSATVSPTNTTVRTYVGTITGQPGLGNVTIHFSLLGAVQGFQDVATQTGETTAIGQLLTPTIAVSSTSPEAVGIDPTPFTQKSTLVVPFAYVKKPSQSPNLANVTNLTQRQAYYLQGASGTLPSAFFGGSSTSDTVYLVARNTAAAVRTEIDANIYFTGTISSWTTNAAGQPIPDVKGGQANGSAVKALLNVIPNAIGTLAAQDIGTLTPLAYEGVPFSIANVLNGSYPIWGYERWAYLKTGQQGAPSANQLTVINALLNAVTDSTFQSSNPVFVGSFAPLSTLQVQRSADGGPITSLLY